jgi:hypothetical protein
MRFEMTREEFKKEIFKLGVDSYDRGFDDGVDFCKSLIRKAFIDKNRAEIMCQMIDTSKSFRAASNECEE